jgi:hypothetical protein
MLPMLVLDYKMPFEIALASLRKGILYKADELLRDEIWKKAKRLCGDIYV